MKIAKFAFGVICPLFPASNIVTMTHWRKARALFLQAAPLGREPASLRVPWR